MFQFSVAYFLPYSIQEIPIGTDSLAGETFPLMIFISREVPEILDLDVLIGINECLNFLIREETSQTRYLLPEIAPKEDTISILYFPKSVLLNERPMNIVLLPYMGSKDVFIKSDQMS